MFTDIVGSVALSRSLDSADWWILLSRCYEAMCNAVHLFGGWVDRFTGDGIKAVFEAQAGCRDDALRACEAAACLTGALADPAARLQRSHALQLRLRIGLHSGELMIGTIGDKRSRRYTATGYTAGIARRIEALAEPGSIWLSDETARLLDGRLRLRDCGSFAVKGATGPVRAYALGSAPGGAR
jgi:class 3 adenylate cyclase